MDRGVRHGAVVVLVHELRDLAQGLVQAGPEGLVPVGDIPPVGKLRAEGQVHLPG